MHEHTVHLIDEAIKIELFMSELYEVFFNAFNDDSDLWLEMVWEEKKHAALLRSSKQALLEKGFFPKALLGSSLEELEKMNERLAILIDKFKKDSPLRENAFNIALDLERSAGEVHFQAGMKKEPESEFMAILQSLFEADEEHAARLSRYMKEHDITENKTDWRVL